MARQRASEPMTGQSVRMTQNEVERLAAAAYYLLHTKNPDTPASAVNRSETMRDIINQYVDSLLTAAGEQEVLDLYHDARIREMEEALHAQRSSR
jgi:hypothetical protein